VGSIQTDIEARLAASEPDVEVLLAEVIGGSTVRLFIDHPEGVSIGLCERVTHALGDLRERYALEVSSPGIERPLTKPEHFLRFRGKRVKVRTGRALEGRRNFTGTIADADASGVSVDLGDRSVTIPHERIHRSNLVPELKEETR
jgi:ribosome maturation factor RimP